jgi:phosphatidylglycerol:prolipoprotein diacylglycerol transferase
VEFTLLWAVLLAVAAFVATLWYETGRTNPAGSMNRLGDRALAAALVGLAAGRLAAMISGGTNPLTHPADIIVVRGGVDTGVASLAGLGTLAWTARHHLAATLDALAPAALAALAGWHASCTFRGSCLGTPSSLPWAYPQPGSGIARHPVELYAALALAAGALALHLWKRRRPRPGVVGAAGLALAAGVRLGTQPLRLALGSAPYAWYAAGAALGVAAAFWAARRRPAPD